MGDDPEQEADDELPPEEDIDRLMAEADPALATNKETPSEGDPFESAKDPDKVKRVKQELDLTPDQEESLDRFAEAEKFEGGPIDPDEDIKDPGIREAVRQAQKIEEEKKQEEEEVEADSDTPVRVDNPESESMSESEDDPEPVSNSEPETPSETFEEEYGEEEDTDLADPFDGDDDEVAEMAAEWSELTTADDIDPDTFDFEDQDFEKIEGHGQEAVITFNGLYFHLTKPDDDGAQSLLAKIQTAKDQGEMFDLVIESVVEQPDMGNKLSTWDFWDRAGLAGRCMQFLGLGDMGEF